MLFDRIRFQCKTECNLFNEPYSCVIQSKNYYPIFYLVEFFFFHFHLNFCLIIWCNGSDEAIHTSAMHTPRQQTTAEPNNNSPNNNNKINSFDVKIKVVFVFFCVLCFSLFVCATEQFAPRYCASFRQYTSHDVQFHVMFFVYSSISWSLCLNTIFEFEVVGNLKFRKMIIMQRQWKHAHSHSYTIYQTRNAHMSVYCVYTNTKKKKK